MASCLECGEWIDPKRWLCKKCEDKIISTYNNKKNINSERSENNG